MIMVEESSKRGRRIYQLQGDRNIDLHNLAMQELDVTRNLYRSTKSLPHYSWTKLIEIDLVIISQFAITLFTSFDSSNRFSRINRNDQIKWKKKLSVVSCLL